MKDVEVVYKGEVILKEPDHYELHAVYQAQEVNEESAEELTTQAEPELPISASKKRTLLVPDPHRFCDHSGYRDHRDPDRYHFTVYYETAQKRRKKIIFRNKPREKV